MRRGADKVKADDSCLAADRIRAAVTKAVQREKNETELLGGEDQHLRTGSQP